ncbi:hypothetical protein EIK56_27240 [Sphingomonas sp. C8-2]|nr:hypothetical protein EIK56_27240 [Sphingomonas sp. C8-2]
MSSGSDPTRLTSDQLGAAGESLFESLCLRARLEPNKSQRDRTGWDFIVELPMKEPDDAISLDHRRPTTCHVQLKSTAGENGPRVSIRLSAIERLAKDVNPAFLIVFRLRPDGEPLRGYLIHLLGAHLARILRRLRGAQARQALDINHATISFNYRDSGVRFDLTPGGLASAIRDACGENPSAYVGEKQRQLATLGFDEGNGLEGEAVVWIEGPQHFRNVMLGLTPIKPKRMTTFERRFGIRLPHETTIFHDADGIFFELPEVGPCTVSVRGPALAPAATFQAVMQVPPRMEGMPWAVIRHAEFLISMNEAGLNFQTIGNFDTAERSLDEWCEIIRALHYLATGAGTLSITMNDGGAPTTSLRIKEPIEGPHIDELPAMLRLLDGWRQLLRAAGIVSSSRFPIDTIWSSHDAGAAVDMLTNPDPTVYLEFPNLADYQAEGPIEALYFNSCAFGGDAITYSVKAIVSPTGVEPWRYRTTAFEPLDIRPAVMDLDEYGEQQADVHDLRMAINPANMTWVEPTALPPPD